MMKFTGTTRILISLAAAVLIPACGGRSAHAPASPHEWTWISGLNQITRFGTYGTKGTAAAANVPGARTDSVSWIDAAGHFWLFGGGGYASAGVVGDLNDLWTFDGTNWTWVSGSNTANQFGTYGTKGTAAAANVPGARFDSATWIDSAGHLWLFGGNGFDSTGAIGNLNDLWTFDGTNWAWVSGANTTAQSGTYGTKGTAAAANVPGARYGAASWIDSAGHFWLFGGFGFDSTGGFGNLNDLWTFDGTNWTWVSGANLLGQSGVYGTKGTAAAANVPGGRGYSGSWIDSAGHFWLFGGAGDDSTGSSGNLNDLWRFDGTNWTWVSGAVTADQSGIYGTKGTAAAANVPGARKGAASWIDGAGHFWLFGGAGDDSTGSSGNLSDLWRFDGTNWTWISGSNIVNHPGTYGTKGTAAAANFPGARVHAASRTDSAGHLWLFGGTGVDSTGATGDLNDLWTYDGTNWTWVSGPNTANPQGTYGTMGTAASSNVLGGRDSATSGVDSLGHVWLFGGFGYDSTGHTGILNDLWRYDGTNWTWVSGANVNGRKGVYGTKGTAAAANVPGARLGSVSWIDSAGHFWLFGGNGYDSTGVGGNLNDLWMFDGTNWTWVSGSNIINQSGTYGTKGTASASNIPGARYSSVSWIDSAGHFWFFGGNGNDSTGATGDLNDLWTFDGTNWTWVSGSNLVNPSGTYGTKGTAAAANVPGARLSPISWIDSAGHFWLFGGSGRDSIGGGGALNDLWTFDGTNWTWVSGSNLVNQSGNYGTKGTASASNIPGTRYSAGSWIDSAGHFWLFGGFGYDSTGATGYLNDLWKFDGTNWTWVSGTSVKGQAGVYGTQGTASVSNIPGGRYNAVSWTDLAGNLWLLGGNGYDDAGTFDYLNDLWRYSP